MSYIAGTATNYISRCCFGVWTNTVGSTERFSAGVQINAHYDGRADVLSISMRDGEPKYVVVGRGTFVVFADDEGIWSIDLEAESWDSDVDGVFPSMKVEMREAQIGRNV
ncbi:MAG: hypothetical protein RXR01_05870 [Thermoproteus sp.]